MRTRIKICGLTRPQDMEAVVDAGVDAVGLVFYANSPRHLNIQQARLLTKNLPPFVVTVGLFVNAELPVIASVLDQVQLTCLQLHGDETPETCALIHERHHLPIIRAARVSSDLDLDKFADVFIRQAGCAAILLDTWTAHYGGSGKVFDWSLIPTRWLDGQRPRLILSGGLHAGNVGHAIRHIRPDAVDTSSGVEGENKGCKDIERIHAFVRAVRMADIESNT